MQQLGILEKQKTKLELIIKLNKKNLETFILIIKLRTVPITIINYFKYIDFDVILLE